MTENITSPIRNMKATPAMKLRSRNIAPANSGARAVARCTPNIQNAQPLRQA